MAGAGFCGPGCGKPEFYRLQCQIFPRTGVVWAETFGFSEKKIRPESAVRGSGGLFFAEKCDIIGLTFWRGIPMEYILEILKAVIYGVIEGITEWLPISSTGHMILAEQVLQFQLSKE